MKVSRGFSTSIFLFLGKFLLFAFLSFQVPLYLPYHLFREEGQKLDEFFRQGLLGIPFSIIYIISIFLLIIIFYKLNLFNHFTVKLMQKEKKMFFKKYGFNFERNGTIKYIMITLAVAWSLFIFFV